MSGNKGKSLAALDNESDADLPAVALLDAGGGLNACGVDIVGSALDAGRKLARVVPSAALPPLKVCVAVLG